MTRRQTESADDKGHCTVQTTRAIGSALGTAVVGILISHSTILNGVRTGLVVCIVLCLICAVLAHRVKMKNLATTRAQS